MTRPPIDELEALVAQATLPWHVGCTGEYIWCGPDSSDLVADCINDEQDMSGNCARAALIVAAVNALPALLVYVRALESLAEARGRAVDAAIKALEIGEDAAYEVAERFHLEMKGYREHEHKALDDDVATIKAARAAIAAIPASAQGMEP